VTLAALRVVARQEGLRQPSRMPRPSVGATSAVYPLGRAVLKVPHVGAEAIEAVRVDARVSGVARQAGVRTPKLIAFIEAGGVGDLAVPCALYERVRGRTLARRSASSAAVGAWREVGCDLAKLHTGVVRIGDVAGLRLFRQSPETDPRPWVAELTGRGMLSTRQSRWFERVLDVLAPAALAEVPQCFCHGDVNAANVLVAPVSVGFLGLIDWAGAGWLDPAWDFAGVPLRVVPAMLAAHREVAPMVHDATAEARILWCHLQFALYVLRSQPVVLEEHRRRIDRSVTRARAYLAVTGLV
jgi:hygromycin-B 7''-O-kinase